MAEEVIAITEVVPQAVLEAEEEDPLFKIFGMTNFGPDDEGKLADLDARYINNFWDKMKTEAVWGRLQSGKILAPEMTYAETVRFGAQVCYAYYRAVINPQAVATDAQPLKRMAPVMGEAAYGKNHPTATGRYKEEEVSIRFTSNTFQRGQMLEVPLGDPILADPADSRSPTFVRVNKVNILEIDNGASPVLFCHVPDDFGFSLNRPMVIVGEDGARHEHAIAAVETGTMKANEKLIYDVSPKDMNLPVSFALKHHFQRNKDLLPFQREDFAKLVRRHTPNNSQVNYWGVTKDPQLKSLLTAFYIADMGGGQTPISRLTKVGSDGVIPSLLKTAGEWMAAPLWVFGALFDSMELFRSSLENMMKSGSSLTFCLKDRKGLPPVLGSGEFVSVNMVIGYTEILEEVSG